jgi:hypothetical protein
MSLSNIAENTSLQDFLTRYPTLYVALSTADPGEDGSTIAEPVGMNYIRQPTGDLTITGNEVTNDLVIVFLVASGNWGTLTYAALFDTESGGTFLGSGVIASTPCPITTVVIIPAGTVILTQE